jgi:hypothetical protein
LIFKLKIAAGECIKRKRLYEQEIDVLNSDQFQKVQNNKTNEIYNKIQEIVSKFSLDLEKESNPPPSPPKEEIKEIPKETPKENVAPVQEKIPETKKKVKKNKITAKRITSILDNYENFVKSKIEKETNIAKEFLQKKNKDCENFNFNFPSCCSCCGKTKNL